MVEDENELMQSRKQTSLWILEYLVMISNGQHSSAIVWKCDKDTTDTQ